MSEQSTERFADQAEKLIPTQDTWDQLTVSQLIDVKMQLEDKLWNFQKVSQISLVLRRSIDQITRMIASNGGG